MTYSVQFVGLACFLREGQARNVLLPDGRHPDDGIDPHFGSIVVPTDSIECVAGWDGDEAASRGVFALVPCTISINGANEPGTLDTSRHDGRLPELCRLAPHFEIDPDRAKTIARLDIRRGTLTAYQVPGGTAIISQLDVPHDGAIAIRVIPEDGSAERRIELKPGTEIAITNTGRGGYRRNPERNGHFRIYEKLSKNPVTLKDPPEISGVPRSPSRHPLFTRGEPAGLSSSCSNTGCC